MPDTLIDTTILVDAANKHPKALEYVGRIATCRCGGNAWAGGERKCLVEGTRNAREQIRLLRFLRQFRFVHSNELDSTAALQFLTRFHLSHDLGFGDCMIGATRTSDRNASCWPR